MQFLYVYGVPCNYPNLRLYDAARAWHTWAYPANGRMRSMTRLPRISGPALLVGILALPTVARADTIRITSRAAISRNELTGVPSDVFGVDVTIASADHGFAL